MPKFKINWEEAVTFEPIPEGVYEAEIDTSECEELTSKSGNPMVNIKFNVLVDGNNRVVSKNYVLSGPGVGFLKELVTAAGLQLTPILDTKELHKKKVAIKVTQDDYNGKVVNNVAKVMPLSEGGGNTGKIL